SLAPAESVGKGASLEEPLVSNRIGPEAQIACGRGKTPAAKQRCRMSGGCGHEPHRAGSRFIAYRLHLRRLPEIGNDRVPHPKGLEDAVVNEVRVRAAGSFLDDASEQDIAAITVFAARSRLEFKRLVLEGFDQLVRR